MYTSYMVANDGNISRTYLLFTWEQIDIKEMARTRAITGFASFRSSKLGLALAQHQLRAFGSEQQCRGAPDARTRAGDDGDLTFEPCRHHAPPLIVAPPSMTMVCPVVKAPARDARNTAAPAISCGSPIRLSEATAV